MTKKYFRWPYIITATSPTIKTYYVGGIRATECDSCEISHTILSGIRRDDIDMATKDAYDILNQLEATDILV